MERTSKSNGQGGIVTPEPAPCEGAGGRSDSSSSPHAQANELLRSLARLLAHDCEFQQPQAPTDKTSDQAKDECK